MATSEHDRPYTQRDVQNMLFDRLPAGKYNWMRDPEGNDGVQAYGERFLPSQPLYVNYRPSTVKMHLRFTPRRISPSREAELWEAAENASKFFRGTGITARRGTGHTQETEKDQQWVVTIPERLSASGLALLESFVALAASCMGIEDEA